MLSLLLGTVVIALVWGLIERDWEIRDQNLDLLDPIHEPLGIRMAVTPGIKWLRGRYIVRFLVGSIIVFNVVAAICFGCH